MGQRATAKVDFDRLLQVVAARRGSSGYRELGKFHLFENDAELALACFNRAVAIAPHYSGNLETRADAYDKLGHRTQAASDRVEATILKRVEETYRTYFTAARQMWCNGHQQWFTEADTRPSRGFASIWKVDQSKEAKIFLALMQSQDQKQPRFSVFFQRYLDARQSDKLNNLESDMYPMLRGVAGSRFGRLSKRCLTRSKNVYEDRASILALIARVFQAKLLAGVKSLVWPAVTVAMVHDHGPNGDVHLTPCRPRLAPISFASRGCSGHDVDYRDWRR